MTNILTKKSNLFFAFLALTTLLFIFYSCKFFENNYKNIEAQDNSKDIRVFLTLISGQYPNGLNKIDSKDLEDIKNFSTNIFDFVKIKNKNNIDFSKIKKIGTLNTIETFTTSDEKYITNYFVFPTNNPKNLLIAKNFKKVTQEGKDTLLTFSIALVFFLLIIVFITITFEKYIEKVNKNLEKKVDERTLQIKQTLSELERLNLKLFDLAHTDHLTQIKNRRSFFMHSKQLFSDSIKKKDSAAVIMIDIDDFKELNDNYGHDFGDKVLKEFASKIDKLLSSSSVFGRIGGEEFAIFIPSSNLNFAKEKAEKLRSAIEELKLKHNQKQIAITASFGVSDNKNCSTIDEMIRKADKELYSAKNSGKNKVRGRD